MRPALSAREIHRGGGWPVADISGFNEARAFCAGNLGLAAPCCPVLACFNEARAFCAGNRRT